MGAVVQHSKNRPLIGSCGSWLCENALEELTDRDLEEFGALRSSRLLNGCRPSSAFALRLKGVNEGNYALIATKSG